MVIEQFGKKVLVDYLTKIYLPIQEYQAKIMGKYKHNHEGLGTCSIELESPVQMKVQYPSDEEQESQNKILEGIKEQKRLARLH